MQVILLERIAKLGQMGDEVSVKPGFARNYLFPQGKALRANEPNRAYFETQRAQLEARNLELKKDAEAVSEKIDGETFIAIRQSGDTGQLYGSVSTRDIANIITEGGFSILRSQVMLDTPIKTLGLHPLRLSLHPEVEVKVTMNVARTEEEAARQASGEDILAGDEKEFETEEPEIADAAEFLEEEAIDQLADENESETEEGGEPAAEKSE